MADANEIHRLISLTFDEDPEIRKKAAIDLAKYNDPGVTFALIELSYDKDEGVRKVVAKLLEEKKKEEPEFMSFAEIFKSTEKSEGKPEKKLKTTKEKVLAPIMDMVDKNLSKEKAEIVKKKLMPTIEKLYDSAVSSNRTKTEGNKRKIVQEMLSKYLSVIKEVGMLEPVNAGKTGDKEKDGKNADVSKDGAKKEDSVQNINDVGNVEAASELTEEIGEVSHGMGVEKLEADIKELEQIEALPERIEEEQTYVFQTFFGKAYEIMLASEGDEKVMKREMKRMTKEAIRDIELAFKAARNKFRARKITNLLDLRSGMRNVYTDILKVNDISSFEYGKRKKKFGIRVVAKDADGNEGVIYLFDGRGKEIKPGMNVKVEKGYVKTFKFSDETALTIGKNGFLYIVV